MKYRNPKKIVRIVNHIGASKIFNIVTFPNASRQVAPKNHINSFDFNKFDKFVVMMIIGIGLCEPSIRSINGFHYNNYGCGPFYIFVQLNETMSYVISMSFHV
jgi:hypothetical protein